MRPSITTLPYLLAASLLWSSTPLAQPASWPRVSAVPGGVVTVPVPGNAADVAPRATFNGRPVWVRPAADGWEAVIGLGLATKSGPHQLTLADGTRQDFQVTDKVYEAQYLTIKNKRHVNPNKLDMQRINREKARKAKARKTWTEPAHTATLPFLLPVDGRFSSPFGLKRFFNKQARRPHSGLDIAAPRGTPIIAPAAGRVIESGDFFFSGNVVYLDHGYGLITLYAHLNRKDVASGDWVAAGQQIGTVGDTGRVTGPHLHWTVYLNGSPVEPGLFFPAPP